MKDPIDEYDLPPRDSAPWRAKGRRYHHGDLFNSAIRRGLEIVRNEGPDALTLRGLARDLKVTASALLYFFKSRVGLRNAVAAWAGRDLADAGRPSSVVSAPLHWLESSARAWLKQAMAEPNLYRAATGEGWIGSTGPTARWWAPLMPFEAPAAGTRRHAEKLLHRGQQLGEVARPVDAGRPNRLELRPQRGATDPVSRRSANLACCVSAALHGLACARREGVPPERIEGALDLLLLALTPGGLAAAPPGRPGPAPAR